MKTIGKRFLRLCGCVLAATLVASQLSCAVSAETPERIAISSKQGLNAVRENMAGHYYLTCDIVFTPDDFKIDGAFYNNGCGFIPIGTSGVPFTGEFDGNGFSISGISMNIIGNVYTVREPSTGTSGSNDGWTGDYVISTNKKNTVSPTVGLFGYNSGRITDLTLSNSVISGHQSNTNPMYIGGIAGYNIGEITRCSTAATLNGYSGSYIGGIAGYHINGTISDCFNCGTIAASGIAGGITGMAKNATILSSYSCCNYRNPVSTGLYMGISGKTSQATVTNCYFSSGTTGTGTQLATAAMTEQASFIGFDFTAVWTFAGANATYTYPILQTGAPAVPQAEQITANTVVLAGVTGCEYKMANGLWQTSATFESLLPNTEYLFYQRTAATATEFASPVSMPLKVKTLKSTVQAPGAPGLESKTMDTVVLSAVEGYEYKMNDGQWLFDNIFTNLTPNTEYTFYQRVAETNDSYASASSAALSVTTPILPPRGDINADGNVNFKDVALLAQFVSGWTGLSYYADNLDVDQNDTVEMADAVFLARCIAGWEGYVL